MADRILVYQNPAQVEWDDPPLLKVFQVIAQVEYDDVVLAKNILVYQVIGQVEFDPIPPPKREFPVPHPNRIWQSQGGKRVFPVVA